MALDIGVGDGSSFVPLQDEPRMFFDDDNIGYYWFLYPLIEDLAKQTGQMIDLYRDASFVGNHLSSLDKMLKDARVLVKGQPASWEVCIGSCLEPHNKSKKRKPRLEKLFVSVDRGCFLELLATWKIIVDRAKRLGRPLVCFGD
jgi:hypothetical protein